MNRLTEQLNFLMELDKLKSIQRRTLLLDKSRYENDAEHSWHLAMMTLVLAEHSNFEDLNVTHAVKLVLVHDIVEIDAGDSYAYDSVANENKREREERAADRLFNLLPQEQAAEYRALWDEFEEGKTPEALFANAVDRVQPLLHNCLTDGEEWQRNNVTRAQVLKRCRPIEDGSKVLWDELLRRIDLAVEKGQLKS